MELIHAGDLVNYGSVVMALPFLEGSTLEKHGDQDGGVISQNFFPKVLELSQIQSRGADVHKGYKTHLES